MPAENAVAAIAKWTADQSIDTEGRDLSPFLTAALLVASADGDLSAEDMDKVIQVQQSLTGKDLSADDVNSELGYIDDKGVPGAIAAVAEAITDPGERSLAVLYAALIADSTRGVGAKAGQRLQDLGRALGFSHEQVLEKLGQAMRAAKGQF